MSSENLAGLVIGYKYLGLFKDQAISAMEELALRRQSGDSFDYENYIDNNLKDLPKLDFSIPSFGELASILKKIKG